MSEYTKTPWKVTGRHFVDAPIGGGRLQEVAWCGDVEHGDREANARHIVHCVNNHERLVDQLAEVKEFMEVELTGTAWADCRHMAHSIGKLLAALEAEKGGEL